jgi:hypothetical protein
MSADTVVVHGIPVFGKGVMPSVGAPQNATANSLVNVLSWTAIYAGGQLQVSAVVEPVNPADAILSLIVTGGSGAPNFTVYAGSDTVVYGNGNPAGLSVAGMAFSALWNPQQYGNQVYSSINGLVISGGQTQPYGFAQTMAVENA